MFQSALPAFPELYWIAGLMARSHGSKAQSGPHEFCPLPLTSPLSTLRSTRPSKMLCKTQGHYVTGPSR